MIELMQYFNPLGRVIEHYKKPNDMNCLGHIAFRIKNIDEAFNHVKNIKGVRFISDSEQYKPYKMIILRPKSLFSSIRNFRKILPKRKKCAT
jgi:methylmalonyl-CoA/ethylmalonyl-CoA epimerase